MKRFYILTLLPLLATFTSCKQFLDIKPNGKTIPKTADEFASLLHTRLNEIDYGTDEPLIGNSSRVSSLEYYADNLDANLTIYPEGSVIPIYIGQQLNNQQTRYSNLYARIRDCNIIIDNLKPEDNEQSKTVLGTAYAIRGISYYLLLREFCEPYQRDDQLGLPLVTSFDMEEKPLRSTYGQTINQIEQDLNRSISFHVKDQLFRFTEDVTRAYLARLHFWTRNWDKAISQSTELLATHPMLDTASYRTMIQSKNTQQGNTLLRSYIFSDNSSDLSYNANMNTIKSRPAAKEFYDLFAEKEEDIRFKIIFGAKRINLKNLFAGVRTDEMCLILAESYAHKSNDGKALEFLNMIRKKRIPKYGPYTLATLPPVKANSLITQDATGIPLSPLMQAILNERRKELYAEGDRFFELKRNGRPSFWAASNGRKYTTEAFMYTFPIPRADIQVNNSLIQNPGYIK
ncbi:MAG: RagB/SusD family nutrient uptake outer membrane protein [Candidatus Pedobacter colombiensis]|uniref:RagB/SusD family nutrient uptake outer membrane protein n=1 Tax=Candidatus Pedobacter colombiensis TaxID=3121371 RepID=A0AAJ5W2W9_9SPHI|nr:RagB/SusD family nutrient uptake outer membrane protein [Pedobacter sp.]WEK17498.1 MAG: RagB/SusD family nutrient uptake outer membrane protein [Pedobacter sp.]